MLTSSGGSSETNGISSPSGCRVALNVSLNDPFERVPEPGTCPQDRVQVSFTGAVRSLAGVYRARDLIEVSSDCAHLADGLLQRLELVVGNGRKVSEVRTHQ
jgi:hypothetical protein